MQEITRPERDSAAHYSTVVLALRGLPDHCAADIGDLAVRIGADKLRLIGWARTDIELARLLTTKISL